MTLNPYDSASLPAEGPPPEQRERPLSLTILCGLFGAVLIISTFQLWDQLPTIRFRFGLGTAILIVLSRLLSVLALIGIWRMARWGVFLYAFLVIIGHTVGFYFQGSIGPGPLILELFVMGVLLYHFRDMHWGL